MTEIELTKYRRIVVLTDGFSDHFYAKTAISLLRYRNDDVVAVWDRELAGKDASQLFQTGEGVPVVDSIEGLFPDAIFLGIAPPGGRIPDPWRPMILSALQSGVDVVSGLHQFLSEDPEFQEAAKVGDSALVDVRKNQFRTVGKGMKFPDQLFRVLTVGQDCTVGKMVTSLELQRELQSRGMEAGFAASGQTGIMISGQGLPIDCVVSDFVSGAAEALVQENLSNRFLMIEGQGSISHPAFSAVTLGLLHGTDPQAMILCYQAKREEVKGFPGNDLCSISDLIRLYESIASVRGKSKVLAISLNSRLLNEEEFLLEKKKVEAETGLPVYDVYREGAQALADEVLKWEGRIR